MAQHRYKDVYRNDIFIYSSPQLLGGRCSGCYNTPPKRAPLNMWLGDVQGHYLKFQQNLQ